MIDRAPGFAGATGASGSRLRPRRARLLDDDLALEVLVDRALVVGRSLLLERQLVVQLGVRVRVALLVEGDVVRAVAMPAPRHRLTLLDRERLRREPVVRQVVALDRHPVLGLLGGGGRRSDEPHEEAERQEGGDQAGCGEASVRHSKGHTHRPYIGFAHLVKSASRRGFIPCSYAPADTSAPCEYRGMARRPWAPPEGSFPPAWRWVRVP